MRARVAGAVAAAVLVAFLGLCVRTASVSAEASYVPPQGPAKVRFPSDFPALVDHQWGFRLGGFGGVAAGAASVHVPVIFVHGNNVDAADWYPVRDDFKAAGWSDQELFALSYNGLGANNGTALTRQNPERDAEHREMGWDGLARVTGNEVNVPDLYDFVRAVQTYTGSQQFSLVGHSLGVTLARRMLKVHPELRADVVAFVGIAGANHGTSFCPPGSEGNVVSCDEIAAGTPWLAALNGDGGADETYGPARWLTVYDGTGGGDPAFAGPSYAESPVLKGADNRTFPGTYHNDLRIAPEIVTAYRTFLEDAEAAARGVAAASASPAPAGTTASGDTQAQIRASTSPKAGGGELAATGRALSMAPLAVAVGALVMRRWRRTKR